MQYEYAVLFGHARLRGAYRRSGLCARQSHLVPCLIPCDCYLLHAVRQGECSLLPLQLA